MANLCLQAPATQEAALVAVQRARIEELEATVSRLELEVTGLRRLDPDVRVLQVHECVRPGNVDGPWVGSVTRPLRASAVGKELARLFRRGGDESA